MNETRHAQQRGQQRCIPPLIRNWLADYGARTPDNRGGVVCYFDQKSRKRLGSSVGKEVVKRLEPLLDSYLVISADDGAVITMGWRYRRVRR